MIEIKKNRMIGYLKHISILGCIIFICCKVTCDARFPGGKSSLEKYLIKNMQWQNKQLTVEGSVFVEFAINKDGTVYNIKIIKGLCKSCDKEAIRLVSNMPNWLPALKNGNPVNSKATIPIYFSLRGH